MTKWHLCVAFSKVYKDEVALASLREVRVTLQARWKEPASIESNVFVKNGCPISRRLPQSAVWLTAPSRREPMFHPLVLQQIACLCNLPCDSLGMGFVSNLGSP